MSAFVSKLGATGPDAGVSKSTGHARSAVVITGFVILIVIVGVVADRSSI
jgi:hypothetical protein